MKTFVYRKLNIKYSHNQTKWKSKFISFERVLRNIQKILLISHSEVDERTGDEC
jgi:hypothetical protein